MHFLFLWTWILFFEFFDYLTLQLIFKIVNFFFSFLLKYSKLYICISFRKLCIKFFNYLKNFRVLEFFLCELEFLKNINFEKFLFFSIQTDATFSSIIFFSLFLYNFCKIVNHFYTMLFRYFVQFFRHLVCTFES